MHNNKVRSYQGFVRRNTQADSACPILVLTIGGLDPSGMAGIVADISTLSAVGASAQCLLTTATAQSRGQWKNAWAVPAEQLQEQLACLAGDTPPAAIKIGALGGPEAAHAISAYLAGLSQQKGRPALVVDPVLRSSSGGELGRPEWLAPLLAHRPLLCPNSQELAQLSSLPGFADCPQLITDAPPGALLTRPDAPAVGFSYQRLPGEWRGTGCTLSTLLAYGLASGRPLEEAVGCALQHLQGWLRDSRAPVISRRGPC